MIKKTQDKIYCNDARKKISFEYYNGDINTDINVL